MSKFVGTSKTGQLRERMSNIRRQNLAEEKPLINTVDIDPETMESFVTKNLTGRDYLLTKKVMADRMKSNNPDDYTDCGFTIIDDDDTVWMSSIEELKSGTPISVIDEVVELKTKHKRLIQRLSVAKDQATKDKISFELSEVITQLITLNGGVE